MKDIWKQIAVILLSVVIAGGAGRLWGEAVAEARVAAVEDRMDALEGAVKDDLREIRKAIENLYMLLLEERYGPFREDRNGNEE